MKKLRPIYVISMLLVAIYFTLDIVIDKLPVYIELPFLIIIFIMLILVLITNKGKRKEIKNERTKK